MPQSEASRHSDASGSARGGAAAVPPGTAALLKRWIERCAPDSGLPDPEARRVVEAVLDDLRGAGTENLDVAGRLWGRAHRSVAQMVERLSQLRVALTASGVEDPLEMHRAIDRITAAATEEAMSRIERVSRTDALTGVGNRRAFDETIQGTLSAASRQGHDVTVVAIDLDGLKKINDTQGHAAGDAALIGLVRSFYDALRDEDMVFRVGGDEFVIVLPFTSVDAAAALMQRVASASAPEFTWGAAGYPTDGDEASDLVDAADRDLYRRRGMLRAPVQAPRRAAGPIARLEGASKVGRWAWVPAAAVIAVSLVATLVSATTGGSLLANRHAAKTHSVPPATAVGGSQGSSASGPGSQAGGTAGSTASGSSGAGGAGGAGGVASGGSGSVLTAGFTPSASSSSGTIAPDANANGSTGAGNGTGGGAGGATGGGAPTPPGGGTGNGGLVGAAEQLLGPLPVVGNDGLLPVLDQLLVGQPSTVAGTITADEVKSPSEVSTATAGSNTGGTVQQLFNVIAGL